MRTLLLLLATAGLCFVSQGTSIVTEFAENAYVNTNGWDFGKTKFNTGTSSRLPGSVKMGDTEKDEEIISPVYDFDIAGITIGTAGFGSGVADSTVRLYGGDGVTDAWHLLNEFHPVNTTKPVTNTVVVTVDEDIRQVKIVFNKVSGTLRVTTFAVSDGEDGSDPPPSGGNEEEPPTPDEPAVSSLSLWRMSNVLKGGMKEDFSAVPFKTFDWTNYVSVCGIALEMNGSAATKVTKDSGIGQSSGFYISSNESCHSLSMIARQTNKLSLFLAVTNDTPSTVLVTNVAYTACQWTNKTASVSATLECAFAVGTAVSAVPTEGWQRCTDADFVSEVSVEEHYFVPRSASVAATLAPGELFLFRWSVQGKSHNPMLGVTDITLSAARKPTAFVLSIQ